MVLRDRGCERYLRVLCLTTSFPNTQDDPAGFFVYQLSDALAQQGIQIEILTPGSRQETKPWPNSCKIHRFSYAPRSCQTLAQLPGGIPVALSLSRKNYLLLPTFFTAFIWGILSEVRKADLILANWAICGALGWFLSPFHKKPIKISRSGIKGFYGDCLRREGFGNLGESAMQSAPKSSFGS